MAAESCAAIWRCSAKGQQGGGGVQMKGGASATASKWAGTQAWYMDMAMSMAMAMGTGTAMDLQRNKRIKVRSGEGTEEADDEHGGTAETVLPRFGREGR